MQKNHVCSRLLLQTRTFFTFVLLTSPHKKKTEICSNMFLCFFNLIYVFALQSKNLLLVTPRFPRRFLSLLKDSIG